MIKAGSTAWEELHALGDNPPAAPPPMTEAEALALPRYRPKGAQASRGTPLRADGDTALHRVFAQRCSAEFESPASSCERVTAHVHYLARVNRWNTRMRSTASAGALRPLVQYVMTPADADEGLIAWWVDDEAELLHPCGALRADEAASILGRQPLAERALRGGAGMVILSADLRRCTAKYANRGYRFALMEVGAAWQNIDLVAAERGIPVRAMGGFLDRVLAQCLALPSDVKPLLAVLVGAV